MKKLFFSALAVGAIVTSAFAANPASILFLDDQSTPTVECVVSTQKITVNPAGATPRLGLEDYSTVSTPGSCEFSAVQLYNNN